MTATQLGLFESKQIFVFGSNKNGFHGKGAAKVALSRFGAIYGQAYGLQGSSFALPTKDEYLRVLPLGDIKVYIDNFKNFAQNNPQLIFNVTRIGTGLSKYLDSDIAPIFKNSPQNCIFDSEWKPYLGENYTYFTNPL